MNMTNHDAALDTRKKVLLVDDDRLVLATLGKGLEHEGYAVRPCASVAQARQVLETERPDIAILDIRMPEASGFELVPDLQTRRDIPFIFLTAHHEQAMVSEAVDLGTLTYLVKPVDVSQLVPVIESSLARAAEFRQVRDTQRQLQRALDENREISMAVGLLMERMNLNRQQAFEHLRRMARAQRKKIGQVAAEMLASRTSAA